MQNLRVSEQAAAWSPPCQHLRTNFSPRAKSMKNDASFQGDKFVYGPTTVPKKMIGCWKRLDFRFSDGMRDSTTLVVWLQTLSGVCDIRIPASRPDLRERMGFEDCSKDELLKLAEQDCFCGITLFDPAAKPFPTASWPKEDYLFRFQPFITFPEPGWIEWRDFGTCMIETAPSGAYQEDWRLLPESQLFAAHLTKRDAASATCLYVVGDHAIYARNRTVNLPSDKSLLELASDIKYERRRLEELLDCEFSYAQRVRPGDDYKIVASTLPWREGKPLGYPWVKDLASKPAGIETLVVGDNWTFESLWCP
jgi:hypothetical protein